MHRDPTPERGNSPTRNADALEAVPNSTKTWHIAGLRVCAVNIIGSSFPNEGPFEEPDIEHRQATDQEDSDEEESANVAPERVARTPSTPDLWGEIWLVAGLRACQDRTANRA